MRLLLGILILLVAQGAVYFQLYAPMKYTQLNNKWWVYGIALPIVWLFTNGTKICAEELSEMWGVRVITFAAGILSFAIFNYVLYQEGINLKNGLCIGLAFLIVGIQIFWK